MFKTDKTMEHISIGSRIECEEHIATVLYVGEVPGTKGIWLGVEWDDPTRGKHDGTHEGIRYFKTEYPKSGSFIRPKKAILGRSFVDALQDRYIMKENDQTAASEMYIVSKNQKITNVEFVGAETVNMKQRYENMYVSRFTNLVQISLRQCQVSSAGEIGDAVPAVEELDLSRNLFSSWCIVAKICGHLPVLRELNLSENRLSLPDSLSEYAQAFFKVHTVYMNRMDYSWEEIIRSTQMLQNLRQLHVCYNKISTVSQLGHYLGQLRMINLEGNPVRCWDEVLKLGELPFLQTLLLNDMKLEGIKFSDVDFSQRTRYFPKLESLSISDNNISQITRVERRGSELDYLRKYGKMWRQSGGHQDPQKNKPSEQFLRDHPRYQELIDMYGAPEDSELKEESTALKNSLISVMLECPHLPNKAPVKKKLPVTMTVQKLKSLAQRLYKADPLVMTISYSSQKMLGTDINMESDQKEIGYYSVEDGDTIHINW
ncbi:hypothetical protein LSH36_31g04030 [Paralvinella palmiformis]|uniref:Tubulin-specific chaperone E n=1 Tax=Paralvinella palmiformis TaxID=53620 RepID=A0AAD9KB33_9ANNE|nr:hypothetical protein LSH36_31g04030 [Paralvinella palmiformis]